MIISAPTQEVQIPWMPEVFSTPISEAIRYREAASANDAVAYYEGIMANDLEALVRSFAGEPVLDDPRVGYVEGARKLGAFVSGTAEWLRKRDAVVENVALTITPNRTVEEVVLHLLADDGVRCAIEYNCVRWGDADIPPQAGVAIYERGSSGLLAAARIYDEVESPAVSDTSVG